MVDELNENVSNHRKNIDICNVYSFISHLVIKKSSSSQKNTTNQYSGKLNFMKKLMVHIAFLSVYLKQPLFHIPFQFSKVLI